MYTMKYIFSLIIVIISIQNLLSQSSTVHSIDKLNGSLKVLSTNKGYKGSPFIYDQFMNSKVYLKSEDKAIDYLLNYNAYEEQIEYKVDGKTFYVTNPKQIKKIEVNNETIVYKKFYNYDQLKEGYFIELIDDFISLYKKETISAMPLKKVTRVNSPENNKIFIREKPIYYISIYGDPLLLIKNKKMLLEVLFNNQDLKNFLKDEKVKLHLEDDLKKLVTFLNNYDKIQ